MQKICILCKGNLKKKQGNTVECTKCGTVFVISIVAGEYKISVTEDQIIEWLQTNEEED